MNRIDRLVATVLLLQSRRIVRAQDIADHFSISLRTVYRDMKALCEAGVPVAAEAGEGYSLVEGYHLPPVMFTADEASALFLGGKFVEKLTDNSMIGHAESALLKIQAVLPDETQEYLGRLQETTAVYLGGYSVADGFRDDTLAKLQEAIVKRSVVAMEYYSHHRDSFSKRQIEPLGLMYYSRRWHVISFCRMRQDFRDFRTDRIRRMYLSDEHFSARPGYSLKDYLEVFDTIEHPIKVIVKYDRRVAALARDRLSFGLVEEQNHGDHIIMTFVVPNLEMMIGSVLSYGNLAEVIAPQELRDRLHEAVKQIADVYKPCDAK